MGGVTLTTRTTVRAAHRWPEHAHPCAGLRHLTSERCRLDWEELFESYDQDGSGCLEFDEFRQASGRNASPTETPPPSNRARVSLESNPRRRSTPFLSSLVWSGVGHLVAS